LGPKSSDCVIPKDPNCVPIGTNTTKEVHYIFIIESCKTMETVYDKLTEDGEVNNKLFP